MDISVVAPSKPNIAIFYIDFETTGLNPYYDEIIEIGIMTGSTKNKMSVLIKPSHPVSDKITSITGISNKILEDEGVPLREAVDSLHHFVSSHTEKGQHVWFVAHNAYGFDKIFFDRLYTKHGFPPMTPQPLWIDSLMLARFAFPQMFTHKLISICRYFKLADKQDHRALADCQLLSLAFPKILTTVKDKISLRASGNAHQMLTDINTLLCLQPYQSSIYPSKST